MKISEFIILTIIAIIIISVLVISIRPFEDSIVDNYHVISIQPSGDDIVVRYTIGNDTRIEFTRPIKELYSNDIRLIRNNSFGVKYFTLYWNGTFIN